jgi:hypothetical protein
MMIGASAREIHTVDESRSTASEAPRKDGGKGFSFRIRLMFVGRINLSICTALLAALLGACSAPTPFPTLTPSPPTHTPIPPSPTVPPTAAATPVPAPERAAYTLSAILDYAAKTVAVEESIIYPNHAGVPLNELVLAVEPNFWLGCFTLEGLSVDGTPVTSYTLDGQKLTLTLPATLRPDTPATIGVQYSLALPLIEPTDPGLSRPRIFGYSPRQINLTNWYPFVVPRIDDAWVLHDPWAYGEHLVYELADFTVNLKPADPAAAPVVAASGPGAQNGDWTTYTLTSGRTFAISASTEFFTESAQVGHVAVTSYYLGRLYKGAAEAALNAAAQALQIFSEKYGPYSHESLAVVMGDFNDGMEFSGLFFHSAGLYNLYDGTMNSLVVAVAAHETAHQWWFEQVANDQALQPWLDEALAAYSEHIFYETASPSSINQWWWIYRVDLYDPQGWVDIPVYAGDGFQPYTNAVYFRGAHFLDDLRTRIGDEAFFGFLQAYVKQEYGRIATAEDFFDLLRQYAPVDFSDIERQYFQNAY